MSIVGDAFDVPIEFDNDGKRESLLLWPKSFVLVSSVDYLRIPDDCYATIHDRSTWARLGVTVQNTIIQRGWQGYLTLEVTNHSWGFRELRRMNALAQILLHRCEEARPGQYTGRYQDQARGPQPAQP